LHGDPAFCARKPDLQAVTLVKSASDANHAGRLNNPLGSKTKILHKKMLKSSEKSY
jgi:hypothetical protein